ncbi:MAG: hypothetical protein LLG44_05875 [Chloroflexi bacterium]|nr:hypothetical protein [Chloroflexota bacterium]
MTIRTWLLDTFFRRELDERIRLSIPARDSPAASWRELSAAPLGPPWQETRAALEAAARLAHTNPLAARIIALSADFTVGSGVELVTADAWARSFWDDPQNRIGARLRRWAGELARSGELFLVLSRNPASWMSYVREVPALLIDNIATDPDDLERELAYHQLTDDPQGITWSSRAADGGAEQVMAHYTVNRAVGEVRGRSDLAPIIPWLEHYEMWLEDRVRINRYKGAYLWQVKVEGALPGQLEAKRSQYSRIPSNGSIIVTDAAETWQAVQPNIAADDAAADGKALRLAIAAGAGVPLHWLAEGESTNRATAREMNAATLRQYAQRQQALGDMLRDLITLAAARAGRPAPEVELRFPALETGSDTAID